MLLPLLRLSSSIAEVSRAQRKRQFVEGDQPQPPKPEYVPIESLKSAINEFRSGMALVVPRLIFNIQAYLHVQPDGCPLTEIKLQDFFASSISSSFMPDESPDTSAASARSATQQPSDQLPPEFILIKAMKISVLEAIK